MSGEKKKFIWESNEDDERWLLMQTGIFYDESDSSEEETNE